MAQAEIGEQTTRTRFLKRLSLHRKLSELYPITLLYLTSLGASGIPLKTALRILGREKLLTPVSHLFAKIQVMVEKWGYLQTSALRSAASDNIDQNHRELLNRLSHAAQAGVGLDDFTRIEFQKFLASSEAEFEKMVEKLKRLAESYSALLSSMGFLSVAFLLMAIIYGSQYSSTVLNISIIAVVATLASMTLLFLRNNIRRRLMHKEPHRPEKLHTLERLSRVVIASSMAVLIIIPLTLPTPSDAGLLVRSLIPGPLSMFIASIPLLLHGIAGRRWIRLVMEREAYMPMFFKSLGDYIAVTGSAAGAAKMMMLSDYGPLNALIRNLYARIRMGVPQAYALRFFGVETLSDLAYKCMAAYGETLRAGGRPTTAAEVVNEYLTTQLLRDKKRKQVSGALKGMVIPLQMTLVAIFGLMNSLMSIFNEISALVSQFLQLITPISPTLTTLYFYWIAVAVAVISALNIYLSDGDAIFTFTFHAGVLLLVSGITYLGVAALSGFVLEAFASIGRQLSSLVST